MKLVGLSAVPPPQEQTKAGPAAFFRVKTEMLGKDARPQPPKGLGQGVGARCRRVWQRVAGFFSSVVVGILTAAVEGILRSSRPGGKQVIQGAGKSFLSRQISSETILAPLKPLSLQVSAGFWGDRASLGRQPGYYLADLGAEQTVMRISYRLILPFRCWPRDVWWQ